MNEKRFILINILFVVIIIFEYSYYNNYKKRLFNEYNSYIKTKVLVERINYYNNIFKNINIPFCKKEGNYLICNNIGKKKFSQLDMYIQKLKIKSLDIEKNKNLVNLKIGLK